MAFSLPADLQQKIDDHIRAGRYPDAETVIRAALFALDDRIAWEDEVFADPAVRESIREKIEEGLAAARAGELIDGDAAFEELEREGREQEESRRAGRKTA